MTSLTGNGLPKRPCPTPSDMRASDAERETKKLRLETGASAAATPPKAPTQPSKNTRPPGPVRSITLNNDREHSLYGRREYNSGEPRRRDSDSTAFTGLFPSRGPFGMRSPEHSSRRDSGTNSPVNGKTPTVRSPAINNSPIMPTATSGRAKNAIPRSTRASQSPKSPMHQSPTYEWRSASSSVSAVKPLSMLQNMLETSQRATISMIESTQAEARLQARKSEEESAKKYEAGYASTKSRQLASRRAAQEAEAVKARSDQLLRDQEFYTTAVDEQLVAARREHRNDNANEKVTILQKQIAQLQSTFEMKLADRDKKIKDLEGLHRSTQEQLQKNQEKVAKHADLLDILLDDSKRSATKIKDLRRDAEAEKEQRESFLEPDIEKLYSRFQDVRDKIGSDDLSIIQPTLAARVLKLEETSDNLIESQGQRETDIADAITTVNSTKAEFAKFRDDIPSTSKGFPSAEEVSKLVKKELEVESAKVEDLLIELTRNLESRFEQKLRQAVNSSSGATAVADIEPNLRSLEQKVQRLGTALWGVSGDDTDPDCVKAELKDLVARVEETENTLDESDPNSLFSLVSKHDEWIGDSGDKLNTLHKDLMFLREQTEGSRPLDVRLQRLETLLSGKEQSDLGGNCVSTPATGSNSNILDPLALVQTFKDIENAVKELQDGHKRTATTLMEIQTQHEVNMVGLQALDDKLSSEIEARNKLKSETGERFLLIEGASNNLSTRFQQTERTTAEEVSEAQKRLEKLEEAIQNKDRARPAPVQLAQTQAARTHTPPSTNASVPQPVVLAFERVEVRLSKLEDTLRTLPALHIDQSLNVCRTAINNLEMRFQNLMTNDLASRILHQLREQSMAVDPGYVTGKLQQFEQGLQVLAQQLKGLISPNGSHESPHLQAKVQKRLTDIEARLSLTPPTTRPVDNLVTGLEDAAIASSLQEHGDNYSLPALTHRLTILESSIKLIASQLKLEVLFQDNGTTEQPTPLLRDTIEDELTKIVKELTALQALKTNINSINDILVTTTADLGDLKRDLDRAEKKADNIMHVTLTMKRKMVKKSHFEDFRKTLGLSSAANSNGTNPASDECRDSDSNSDQPLAARSRSARQSSTDGIL